MSTYFGLDTKLQGRCRESRKLAHNTYARRRNSGKIAIQLHATDILTFHSDGQIDLNTGGWNTVTTHSRMNAFLPGPWRVGTPDQLPRGLQVRPGAEGPAPGAGHDEDGRRLVPREGLDARRDQLSRLAVHRVVSEYARDRA